MENLIGIELIKKERIRQIEKEGWTKEHDVKHREGELSTAAACYAAHASGIQVYMPIEYSNGIHFIDPWPWDGQLDKRNYYGDRKRDAANYVCDPKSLNKKEILDLLVKAGALIAAEIDKMKNE